MTGLETAKIFFRLSSHRNDEQSPQESALIRLDWSGCLPPECVPDHNNLDTWAKSVLSDQALLLVNSTLKLENEHIECEKDMVYDTGAYVGTVLLVIVASLVLIGKESKDICIRDVI